MHDSCDARGSPELFVHTAHSPTEAPPAAVERCAHFVQQRIYVAFEDSERLHQSEGYFVIVNGS